MTWKAHHGVEQEKEAKRKQALDGLVLRLQHIDVAGMQVYLIVRMPEFGESKWRTFEVAN